MRVQHFARLVLVLFSLSGCAAHDREAERDHHERETHAQAPSCPNAVWEAGHEMPDGRWEPGRWQCPERREERPGTDDRR
jgi:hypothetical protein